MYSKVHPYFYDHLITFVTEAILVNYLDTLSGHLHYIHATGREVELCVAATRLVSGHQFAINSVNLNSLASVVYGELTIVHHNSRCFNQLASIDAC